MKTKQEVIQEEWLKLGIKTKFSICENTGYCIEYCVNGIEDVLYGHDVKIENIDFDIDSDDIVRWRPKSLQGIENNNGWVRIEDKPVERWNCFNIVFTDKEEVHTYPTYCNFASIYETQKITHYLKINPPKKPIY